MKVLVEKTKERETFIELAFKWAKIPDLIRDKNKILIKPNIVSSEPYPTTTHPQTLAECLEILLRYKPKEEIKIGDGPAFDAGKSKEIIKNHPLKKVCDNFGIELIDLNTYPKKRIKLEGYKFDIAKIVLESDFIISLPVLKTHKTCGLTGALKNQYGFLSPKNKLFYHLPFKNIHRAIALINKAVVVDFWIVDAIEALISAQEKRHGGKIVDLGYMLAGFNPIELDKVGLELLQKVEPKLRNKKPEDIPQIKWAIKENISNLFK
jgi:uncharacterized protein (DUF362 family)